MYRLYLLEGKCLIHVLSLCLKVWLFCIQNCFDNCYFTWQDDANSWRAFWTPKLSLDSSFQPRVVWLVETHINVTPLHDEQSLQNICSPRLFNFKWAMVPTCCRWSYGWCHYFSGTETEAPGVLIGQLMNRGLERMQWQRRWWWGEAAPILIFSVVGGSDGGCGGLQGTETRSSSPGIIRAWQNLIHRDNVKSLAQDNDTKAGRPVTVFHILPNLPSYMALFYGFIA